jgi:hypothetical protein
VLGKHGGTENILDKQSGQAKIPRATEGDELKALTWHGKRDIRVDNVPDPTIQEPTDAVVRMSTTAICGSDLHLYEVLTPFMEEGDVLERVMNSTEKAHQDANSSVNSALRRLPVFSISKPLPSKFITASRARADGRSRGGRP